MAIMIELWQLKTLCSEMAELGAANYVKQTSPSQDSISQRAAYLKFGRNKVEKWRESGTIKPYRMGPGKNSKLYYSTAELQAAEKAEKLNILLNN